NVNTTWWPVSKPFHYYLGRCSYLLQQGLPVADVCYYYGDNAPNLVAPPRVDPALGEVDPNFCKHCQKRPAAPLPLQNPAPTDALGAGYDYDVVNSDVILSRMQVKNGRIVLPDGMSYAVLVLPEREDMPLAVLQKLDELVRAGATILGPKPTRTNTLSGYPQCDQQIKDLADKLWGECDGMTVHERRCAQGRIVWNRNRVRQVLADLKIGADCTLSASTGTDGLDYVHRRTEQADIYFISNSNDKQLDMECVFRVSGKCPELWMPETGAVARYPVYERVAAGTKVPLLLPAYGSAFVVFRQPAAAEHLVAVPQIFGKAPTTEDVPAVELIADQQGKLEWLAWTSGTCVFPGTNGTRREVVVEPIPAARELTGPWEVRFAKGRGAPASKVFEDLHAWNTDPEEGVKYFSGTAAYHKQFVLPDDGLNGGNRVFLDLGRVRNVAEVTLNDKRLGICWTSPARLEVTGILRPGANTLVVEVTNLWANRMIGDGKLPKEKRICQSCLPPLTGPLLDSGLLGPVRLLNARRIVGDL
ncbi:MAG: glycosyl hydrolase, partial [Verrucomicrobiota bacterium]